MPSVYIGLVSIKFQLKNLKRNRKSVPFVSKNQKQREYNFDVRILCLDALQQEKKDEMNDTIWHSKKTIYR